MERYYIDTQGNDDKAYHEAIMYACQAADKDPEIKYVILLIGDKKQTEWFKRLYGDTVVKKLFIGTKLNNCKATFKFETLRTYQNSYTPSEIVIACGLHEEEISPFDNYQSIKVIIAIPWLREKLQKWVQTWGPIELRGKGPSVTFPPPSCIVKKAMEELTESINMATGITHPSDEKTAKTYILALHKYEPNLDANIVGAYLVRELQWDTSYAQEIENLINILNDGKHFKGGERTGLINHYDRWKEDCESEDHD